MLIKGIGAAGRPPEDQQELGLRKQASKNGRSLGVRKVDVRSFAAVFDRSLSAEQGKIAHGILHHLKIAAKKKTAPSRTHVDKGMQRQRVMQSGGAAFPRPKNKQVWDSETRAMRNVCLHDLLRRSPREPRHLPRPGEPPSRRRRARRDICSDRRSGPVPDRRAPDTVLAHTLRCGRFRRAHNGRPCQGSAPPHE